MDNISENIKKLRKDAGFTQQELSKKTGLSIASIQGYEQGKYKPKIEQLKKIATALNVPVSVFLDELSEEQRIKSTLEWINDNNEKRKVLISEILNTHGYRIDEMGRFYLIITDHQGLKFRVRKSDFQEMIDRCDKDIRYNIEKLINNSPSL